MKHISLLLFLLPARVVFAQPFTESLQFPPLTGVDYGSVAFADVDGDNDEDMLITGSIFPGGISKLYINDGEGMFTEVLGTPFEGVWSSAIAFADVNGDNDQDVLITGKHPSRISKLYTNDGTGTYTEVEGTPFDGVEGGAIAFADIDGDNDQDVLITGSNNSNTPIAKLYINNGLGVYTELAETPFEGVWYSSIAFADVDGDNDQDVLITGRSGITNLGARISSLYINNGTGIFTEITPSPFEGVAVSSIAFADVDGDSDQDVLITGVNDSFARVSKLYTNDGTGIFTEITPSPFEGVAGSSIAFADVDGDDDQDVLITGLNESSARVSKLYTNDGTGIFTEITPSPFEGVAGSSIAFADVDGDNDKDVLITGLNESTSRVSKLYTNNGTISLSDDILRGISSASVLFPNPVIHSTLFIDYNSPVMGKVIISIYNVIGHLLIQQTEHAINGKQTYSVDLTSLPQGNYFLELNNGKKREVINFTKQQ